MIQIMDAFLQEVKRFFNVLCICIIIRKKLLSSKRIWKIVQMVESEGDGFGVGSGVGVCTEPPTSFGVFPPGCFGCGFRLGSV